MLHGTFKLFPGTEAEICLPNFVPSDGAQTLLRMILWGDTSIVAGGGNFYAGLMGPTADFTTLLSTLIGEPAGHGYARQPIPRSNAGWPTETITNNVWHTQSQTFTFTSSDSYVVTAQRIFLCSVSAGSSGRLIAVSAPFPAAFTVTSSNPLPCAYDFRQD